MVRPKPGGEQNEVFVSRIEKLRSVLTCQDLLLKVVRLSIKV